MKCRTPAASEKSGSQWGGQPTFYPHGTKIRDVSKISCTFLDCAPASFFGSHHPKWYWPRVLCSSRAWAWTRCPDPETTYCKSWRTPFPFHRHPPFSWPQVFPTSEMRPNPNVFYRLLPKAVKGFNVIVKFDALNSPPRCSPSVQVVFQRVFSLRSRLWGLQNVTKC